MAIKPKTKISIKDDQEIKTNLTIKEAKSLISFRTKQSTKKKAEKIFDDIGVSMSSAINMFLTQVVRDKGLPFTPTAQKRGSTSRVKDGAESNDLGAFEELWEDL